jgi:iron complex outermembrane receptor protein
MRKIKVKKPKNFSQGLAIRGGQSLLAAAIAALAAGGAYAQDTQIEEIVVTGTGTSIRGEAPVGQNLISIGREAIQESGAVSVQQILNDVPQITGFGNQAQGGYGASDGSGTYSPTIHSLGASASNSTLIVINGHRLPLTGISHNTGDPSIIPPAALERVEILPDGASATYGSDAVAGVLNFITRTDVEGIEMSAQTGFSEGNYKTANVNLLTGNSWGSGSLTAAYAYSYRSALANADRPNIQDDLRSRGGSNRNDDNCGPGATLDGNGGKFLYPYSTTNLIPSGGNPCTTRNYTDLIGSELRHSVFVGFEQDYGDNMKFDAELVYSDRESAQVGSRGTRDVSINGATITNPFYIDAPDGDQTYTARWESGNAFGGRGQDTHSGSLVFMLTSGLEYDFGNGWFANVGGTVGKNISYRNRENGLCSDCLTDAVVNGVDVNGTLEYMNIWGDPSSVHPRVLSYIFDNNSQSLTTQTMVDLKVKIDGDLMELPAGTLKVAFGANTVSYSADYDIRSRSGGPATTDSRTNDILITRDVDAVFAEVLVPITERISFSAAVRTDDYSDFGRTTNPRVAAQWYLTEDIKVRASWAESFVAPALSSRGQAGTGITTESGFGGRQDDGFIPVDFSDDSTADFLAFAVANGGDCAYDGATLLGCDLDGFDGGRVTGGNDDLVAATGKTWSIGIDITNPEWLPGFRGEITYYDALLNRMITAPRLNNILEVPGLNNRIILMPTQAEVDDWTAALPQTGSSFGITAGLPAGAVLPFIWSFQQINAFNIDSAGLDINLTYAWDTDLGELTVNYATNKKLRFDQQGGEGAEWIDYLNTDANTTFSSLEYIHNASLGWRTETMSAKLTWKHQNEYDGTSVARTDTIDAFNTFNLYTSYELGGDSFFGGTQLFMQMNNMLDEEPPYFNTSGGYNSSDSSPLGRVTTLGFRKTF